MEFQLTLSKSWLTGWAHIPGLIDVYLLPQMNLKALEKPSSTFPSGKKEDVLFCAVNQQGLMLQEGNLESARVIESHCWLSSTKLPIAKSALMAVLALMHSSEYRAPPRP